MIPFIGGAGINAARPKRVKPRGQG